MIPVNQMQSDAPGQEPFLSRIGGDFLRVVAMLAVLAIHATGRWESVFRQEHDFFSQAFLAVLLNQLARFSVPLFVLLSGYALARRYHAAWSGDSGNGVIHDTLVFYRRRLWKIGVPFLVWTLVILALTGRFRPPVDTDAWVDNLQTLMPYLLWRGADYHFYFFIIILQMYLLFPFIFRMTRAASLRTKTIGLILLFGWQLLWTYPSVEIFRALGWPRPTFPTAFFIYWVFYFYAGVYCALLRPAGERASASGAIWIPVVLAVSFGVMLAEYIMRSYSDPVPGYYNHFSRWSVVVFSMLVFALLVAWDGRLQSIASTRPRAAGVLGRASALTFAVYLYHTWILRGIQATPVAGELFSTIVVLAVLSFGLAYLLDRLVKPGWIRTVLGLP